MHPFISRVCTDWWDTSKSEYFVDGSGVDCYLLENKQQQQNTEVPASGIVLLDVVHY